MKPSPEEPRSNSDEPTPSEEARRIVEEYIAALREIIKKLRRKLHYGRRRIGRDHSPIRVMERNAEPTYIVGVTAQPSASIGDGGVSRSRLIDPGGALLMIKGLAAAQCREFAEHHKAQAKDPGISQKRATLFANIARSFNALASQLEMLADDIAQKPGK